MPEGCVGDRPLLIVAGVLEPDWGRYTPEQEQEWRVYFDAERTWEDSHPNGPWEPVDECWAAGWGELWDAVDHWREKLTPGEHPVKPVSDGYMEECRLTLEPWPDED